MKPTAQDIQDEIFRKMPPAKKLELGFQFWELAKKLVGKKLTSYDGRIRPKISPDTGFQNA